jgi:Raf kinase inhibitor-like YbhB/YbcL family protein
MKERALRQAATSTMSAKHNSFHEENNEKKKKVITTLKTTMHKKEKKQEAAIINETKRLFVAHQQLRVQYESDCRGIARRVTAKEVHFKSDVIRDGGIIPPHFGCDAGDVSPPFKWSVPSRTFAKKIKSFVIVVDDPDSRLTLVFTHLAVINLPPTLRGLVQNQNWALLIAAGARVLNNDHGTKGWRPPCPPTMTCAHNYRFSLWALTCVIDVAPDTKLTLDIFENMFRNLILSRSTFTAYFARPPSSLAQTVPCDGRQPMK